MNKYTIEKEAEEYGDYGGSLFKKTKQIEPIL